MSDIAKLLFDIMMPEDELIAMHHDTLQATLAMINGGINELPDVNNYHLRTVASAKEAVMIHAIVMTDADTEEKRAEMNINIGYRFGRGIDTQEDPGVVDAHSVAIGCWLDIDTGLVSVNPSANQQSNKYNGVPMVETIVVTTVDVSGRFIMTTIGHGRDSNGNLTPGEHKNYSSGTSKSKFTVEPDNYTNEHLQAVYARSMFQLQALCSGSVVGFFDDQANEARYIDGKTMPMLERIRQGVRKVLVNTKDDYLGISDVGPKNMLENLDKVNKQSKVIGDGKDGGVLFSYN